MRESEEYRRRAAQVTDDARWTARKVAPTGLLLLLAFCALLWALNLAFQPFRAVSKVADADNVIQNYEEFQTVYNTTVKINRDLCNLRDVPETDPMFAQFSKAQRITATKANLDRWIESYNGKSRMITRSAWKSGTLPHQLSTSDYNCYAEKGVSQ